jgi:hypothetical protein
MGEKITQRRARRQFVAGKHEIGQISPHRIIPMERAPVDKDPDGCRSE